MNSKTNTFNMGDPRVWFLASNIITGLLKIYVTFVRFLKITIFLLHWLQLRQKLQVESKTIFALRMLS